MTSHRRHGALILVLLLLAPGCVTTQPWTGKQETPPAISQVHGFWDGRIQETQDVVNGGRPLRGLAGRVYLFGPDLGVPVKGGDGSVAVDLYDVSDTQPGAQPKSLERWQFDASNLHNLIRKDKIGWGYTLFLPWSTSMPDISRVQLNVCYTPAKGNPLYGEPTTISLRSSATLTQTQSRQLVGPNGAPAARQ